MFWLKCNNIVNRVNLGIVGVIILVLGIGVVFGFVSVIGIKFMNIVGVMFFLIIGNVSLIIYLKLFCKFFLFIYDNVGWCMFFSNRY